MRTFNEGCVITVGVVLGEGLHVLGYLLSPRTAAKSEKISFPKAQTNNECVLLTLITCYILFLCVTELHCWPKTIKAHQCVTLLHQVAFSFITYTV